jgi:hypothetical protein
VPELQQRSLAVITCAAEAEALDALVAPGHGARLVRSAPDDLLVIAPADVGDTVEREVRDRIAALDPDALVLDASDGWHAWALRGDDASHALSYITALDPPAGGSWVQGDVARVGAIVIGDDDGFTMLVPAFHGEHIRERAVADALARERTT